MPVELANHFGLRRRQIVRQRLAPIELPFDGPAHELPRLARLAFAPAIDGLLDGSRRLDGRRRRRLFRRGDSGRVLRPVALNGQLDGNRINRRESQLGKMRHKPAGTAAQQLLPAIGDAVWRHFLNH